MTTRNFRVNNGLSVGDITISASANTITGLATSAPSGDGDVSNKKYVDDQDAAIASDTLTFTNKTIDANGTGNSITNLEVADFAGSAIINVSETLASNDSDTALVTAGAIIDYVDAQDANIAGDTLTFTNKTFDANGTGNSISNIDFADFASGVVADEDNMSSNSATKLATQQSIKAYVDTELGALSSTTLTSADTNSTFTVSNTSQIAVVNSATQLTITQGLVRIHGNLTVDGTETIINTSTLSVEDNIIEVNRNVSSNAGMPTISGVKVNRGEGSTATEGDLYWAWDESFADDGTTIHGNAGGAWTAFRSANADVDALVDIRANVVHALSTSAQYADVAERFEADAPMSAGAVVEVGGSAEITETTSDMSENVFGVISDMPAYAMNAAAGNNESHPYVAMTGRTPVRVTGAVTKGQRLVTSNVKGCARAVATGETISPFNVIGRALESSTDAGIKLVNCAVRTNN